MRQAGKIFSQLALLHLSGLALLLFWGRKRRKQLQQKQEQEGGGRGGRHRLRRVRLTRGQDLLDGDRRHKHRLFGSEQHLSKTLRETPTHPAYKLVLVASNSTTCMVLQNDYLEVAQDIYGPISLSCAEVEGRKEVEVQCSVYLVLSSSFPSSFESIVRCPFLRTVHI